MASKTQDKEAKVRKLCEEGKYQALLECTPQERLNQGFKPDLDRPIHYFAARGNLRAVRELVEKYKCDPECKNEYGFTPLHCASYYGRLSVVKYLINKQRCDANLRDKEGACPLAFASLCVMEDISFFYISDFKVFKKSNKPRKEHIDTAKFLLAYTTLQTPSLTKPREVCILRLPVYCGSFSDFMKLEKSLSLKLGANSPELILEVSKCLEIALSDETTQPGFAESILRTYAYYIKEQSSTKRLFHIACDKTDITMAKLFIELGICTPDVESVKIAIDKKNYELVQYLIQSADHSLLLDKFNHWRYSSLLTYVFLYQKDDDKLLSLVLEATVGRDISDADGNSPLHLLCKDFKRDTFIPEEYTCYQTKLNNNLELPLHIACKSGDLKLTKLVSSQLEMDINAQDIKGNTPLHIACSSFQLAVLVQCVEYFIHEKKGSVSILNNMGELPLHTLLKYCVSVMTRDDMDEIKKVCKLIFDHSQCCPINAKNNSGETLLHIACNIEYPDIVLYLISNFKCDINIQNNFGELPLHIIFKVNSTYMRSYYYDADVKKKILEMISQDQCCRINTQDSAGNTPLHIACKNGDSQAVLYLTSKFQCDLNIVNNEECLPLHYALSSDLSLEAVKAICSGCSLISKQNSDGETPLHIVPKYLSYRFGYVDSDNTDKTCLLDLICCQESVNIRDNEGNTPLHIACREQDLVIATYLTSKFQCDFELLNKEHCLPIHYAVGTSNSYNSLELAKVVSECTLMHVQNVNRMTPLHIACENDCTDTVKYLVFQKGCVPSKFKQSSDIYDTLKINLACKLEEDIDLLKALANDRNVDNRHGYYNNAVTPIHTACKNQNPSAVKILLELNCNLLCKGERGMLPIHVACSRSFECVRVMSAYTNLGINERDDDGNTPLHVAFQDNHLDIVELLLTTFQCDISISNRKGELPLHLACKTNCHIVKMVMEMATSCGILVNSQNKYERNNPLHLACKSKALDIVKYLTESFNCEPSMTVRNMEGKLPVDYACEHSLEMVKLVCRPCTVKDLGLRMTDPKESMYFQQLTTLDIACKSGSLPCVRFLINEKGCSLSALENDQSALAYACGLLPRAYSYSGAPKTDIVYFLISECGYNPTLSINGISIIHFSCKLKSLQLVEVLVPQYLDFQDLEGNTLLCYACKYDSVDITAYLVDQGCKQNITNNKGESALHMACRSSLEVTKLLKNCDVNMKNTDGQTPLHIACESKMKDIAQYLIEELICDVKITNNEGEYPLHIACTTSIQITSLVQKSDINCQDNFGDTPLHNACYVRDSDMIKFLLNHKDCRANIRNKNGDLALHNIFYDTYSMRRQGIKNKLIRYKAYSYRYTYSQTDEAKDIELVLRRHRSAVTSSNHDRLTPFDMAIKGKKSNAFKVLFNATEADEMTGVSLLHKACAHGWSEIVQWLIDNGASTELTDDNGDYPQHICFRNNHYVCLDTLKQLGSIDICKQNKKKDTILHLACKKSDEKTLKSVLETFNCKNAFSVQNTSNSTPLHLLAAKKLASSETIALIECDNPNLENSSGNTALHLACQYQYNQLAEHLITICKCDLNVTNSKGELPLHIAVALSEVKIIELLATTENVNKCTKSGKTPLHIACQRANPDITKLLLAVHANQNTPDGKGNIALHIASATSLENVKLLATSNVANLQNIDGDTPLHIACQSKNLDIIFYLLNEIKCSVILLNKNSESAFHILFRNSHCHSTEMLKSTNLLSYVPTTLNDVTNKAGNTLLHIACGNKHANYEVVKHLIEITGCKITYVNQHSGATALHFACYRGSVSIVKLVSSCNPLCKISDISYIRKEMKFVSGDTPLHVACRRGNIDVIKHLLQTGHSQALSCSNTLKELPIHLAVQANESIPLLKIFEAHKSSFDTNATNKQNGDTILHIACRKKRSANFLKQIIQGLNCKVDVQNIEGNLPLHIACQNYSIGEGVLEGLCQALSDDQLKLQNHDGNTAIQEFLTYQHGENSSNDFTSLLQLFHNRGLLLSDHEILEYFQMACHYQKLSIVKYLQEEYALLSKNIPNTILYEACLNCNEYVLGYILKTFEHLFDVNVPNKNGDLPLHLAMRTKVCTESTILLLKNTKDINHQNNQGNTPLHELYSGTKPFVLQDILLTCLEVENVDFSKINSEGCTPLHCMCNCNKFDHLKTVLKKHTINANILDENGRTLLHLSCKANNYESVKLLLKVSMCDPLVQDHQMQAPINLTTDPKIIKLLIEHGADPQPLYQMHKKFFEKYSCEKPPPTPVMIMMIGYPSVGKTTLTQSLRNSEQADEVISEHFDHTAGIVPTKFNSQHYGDVTFYDFAGQAEYYASHDAVLHSTIKNVPPIVLILVNLNEPSKSILNQTKYWINFMAHRCSGLGSKAAHMILVGSHADIFERKGRDPSEKMERLRQSVETQLEKTNILLKGEVHINCTKSKSVEMSRLQQLLQQSTNDLREKGVLNFNSHCFYVFLLHMSESSNVVMLGHILSTLKSKSKDSKSSPLFALSFDRPKVIELCRDLNEKGHIMFIEHPNIIDMSWLILDKAPLLQEILGTLFSPTNFPQHCPLSYSTGVVPFSRFDNHFSTKHSYPPILSVIFLSRMEYCRQIKDPVVLESIIEEDFSKSEKYYFFPNLVSLERPNDVWSKGADSNIFYKSGWLIQCKEEGECFSPHFIQALLLRLAFSFTPKKEEDDEDDYETYYNDESSESEDSEDHNQVEAVVIKRQCSVWKNGIYWQEESSVQTVVEIINNSTLVLLMQCSEAGAMDLVHRRSLIISMVLRAKDEFCSKAELREYFIHPSAVVHPLENVESDDFRKFLFPIKNVMKTISLKQRYVINGKNERVTLEHLLYYEPFSELSRDATKVKKTGNLKFCNEQLSIFNGREISQVETKYVVKSGQIIESEADRLFKDIALEICDKYTEVGIELGLEYTVLTNELETGSFEMKRGNLKALKMLHLWRKNISKDCFTYSMLAAALEKCGCWDCAHEYCYTSK